jgi:5'-3' exonuclease
MTQITLVDLSSVLYPIWHLSSAETDPNTTSTRTIARVRELAAGPHAAICCDSRQSWRRDRDPSYKAQRDATDREPLYHQMALVIETLRADGYPIWQALGFEADDVIASATARALALPDVSVEIVSADKDLLALVGDRVTARSLKDGSTIDAAAVVEKFGVRPDQIVDYLTLVGDASDNVKGAAGIGPKKAADLLSQHGTLEGIYYALTNFGTSFTPGLATSLREFQPRIDDVRTLIRMRTDVPIPFDEIAAERVPTNVEPITTNEDDTTMHENDDDPLREARQELIEAMKEPERTPPPTAPPDAVQVSLSPRYSMPAQVPAAAPLEWERQLEPRSLDEARVLAKFIFDSKLFGAYGTPQAVLMTVMAGREFGLQAMASLRAFHIVQGKPVLAADAIRALVLKSGLVKSFRCVERTVERATFTAQRGSDPAISLTYTIEEAKEAGLLKPGSGWVKYPADMLVARASAKLARLVAPEVTFGLYAPEEIDS